MSVFVCVSSVAGHSKNLFFKAYWHTRTTEGKCSDLAFFHDSNWIRNIIWSDAVNYLQISTVIYIVIYHQQFIFFSYLKGICKIIIKVHLLIARYVLYSYVLNGCCEKHIGAMCDTNNPNLLAWYIMS